MSHQKIDKLFKERLSGFEQAPSAEAWNKLEGMLANKKKKILYFRLQIAASITVLLLFGWVFWSSQRSVIQQNDVPLASLPIDSIASSNYAKVTPEVSEVEEIAEPTQQERVIEKLKPTRRTSNASQLVAQQSKNEVQKIDSVQLQNIPETMLAENKPLDEELKKQVSETLPPVMIIYKTSSTEAIAQNANSTGEKNTWDAVLTVAKDFKQGNLNLTSRIKEAKEDLFDIRINKNKDNSK